MERALRDLAALGEGSLTLKELGREIDQILRRVMYLPNLFICLIDEEPPRIRFVYCRDEHDRHVDRPIDGKGFTDKVYLTRKSLLIQRTQSNEMLQAGQLVNHGVPSLVWLGVPLLSGERILGVMAAQDYEDAKNLRAEHEEKFMAVAALIAGLVERSARWTDRRGQIQNEQERRRQIKALFATIGHEIRSPLSVIQGFSDLLIDDLRDSPGELTAQRIAKAALELSDATDRLLDYTSAESGAADTTPVSTDLRAWSISYETWAKTAASFVGVEVEAMMTVGNPISVRLDAERLRQLLQHLMRIAFHLKGVAKVRWGLREQPVYTIPHELLRLAFYIEAQPTDLDQAPARGESLQLAPVDLADGRTYDGTTVSLAIAERFAEMLGAEITVSAGFDAPWRATVVLTAPVVLTPGDDKGEAATSIMRAKLQQQSQRVVVVTSDEDSRTQILQYFEEAVGASPHVVSRVAELTDLLRTEPIGVVIALDESGASRVSEVHRALQNRADNFVKPYVIAVSHDQSPDGVERLLDDGADAYVPCPLNVSALIVVLSEAWLEYERRSE